ncbi:reverse transcriptase domain-containing protein [Tanacetum coccineum]
MLERLAGNEYYCFLDSFSRYFQIPIDPKDQDKTTFTCPYGTFSYRQMPFGLCNAPGTFQRCMMAIFHDMIEETMEVFMDDFSDSGDSFSSCLSGNRYLRKGQKQSQNDKTEHENEKSVKEESNQSQKLKSQSQPMSTPSKSKSKAKPISKKSMCHSKDSGPLQGLYLCRIVLRVHFSQLGPLGLNKVITFKVLCRSLQIELMMALFRVFQTLCKQGDWFSFTKRRAPSPVCIDDNRSCMKHWKSGFFFINQRDIPDSMVWRHPGVTIDDPRPVAGSHSMADVRRLSAHVIKLRDMPEGVLVLSGLSRVWKNYVCDPVLRGANGKCAKVQQEPHLDVRLTLQRLPFYFTPPAAADGIIPDHTSEDLAVGDSDDESDGDDDACVEILLVTPLHSAAVISPSPPPPSCEPGWELAAPALKVLTARSLRDVSRDAIHADFFPFSAGPYYATYPKCSVVRNYEFTREEWDAPNWPTFGVLTKEVFNDPVVCKTMVDQFPTPGEMVRFESLSGDQLTAKKSVLHCLMLLHGGELLARYHGLNQSHHEYVLSEDSRMKGYEEKVASLTGLELQVSSLNKQVSRLNDKLSSSDASFAKSKAKGKYRKKKIKSLTKSLWR